MSDRRICGYIGRAGWSCNANPDHTIHAGLAGPGGEEPHDFAPYERRVRPDRRAATPPQPSAGLRAALDDAIDRTFDRWAAGNLPNELLRERLRRAVRHAALAAKSDAGEGLAYEERVVQVALALHHDCVLEWQAIGVVDPDRLVTQHMPDAHYGQAHNLVRRIWPELDATRLRATTDETGGGET